MSKSNNGKVRLDKIDPAESGSFKSAEDVAEEMEGFQKRLYDLHYQMYAENRRSLLIILQGIDASGKDGTVRYLAGGFNPQGLKIHSFKKPSEVEIDHDYLWRVHQVCPGRGEVAIFNRSHYEEVTVVKIHPDLLHAENLPPEIAERKDLFKQRYRQIRDFERILAENGTVILKFLLHISKEKQEKRFAKRQRERTKLWKFSPGDLVEREYWDEYMRAFAEMIEATDAPHAPWHIIPADKKWYRNYLIGKVVTERMEKLKMEFPDGPTE
jgi:PPK2 family polyphosphate:nucleotide phosphotransferase